VDISEEAPMMDVEEYETVVVFTNLVLSVTTFIKRRTHATLVSKGTLEVTPQALQKMG